jgi:hypothetical protein
MPVNDLTVLDAWIERHPEAPSRPEAMRQIIRERLGTDPGSTVIPNIVTGRDIV